MENVKTPEQVATDLRDKAKDAIVYKQAVKELGVRVLSGVVITEEFGMVLVREHLTAN